MDQFCTITIKRVRISACAVKDDVPKIEEKHLIFKASIAEIKTRILIDNNSKAKLINKSFVRSHRISTSKLKKKSNWN